MICLCRRHIGLSFVSVRVGDGDDIGEDEEGYEERVLILG